MNEIFCSHDTLRMASQSGPPTCVSYDACHEMIFVGWSNGEVSTYRASCLNDNLINWSAFPAHRTSVLQTFGAGCDLGLYSLSSEWLKIHTSGGMELFSKRSLAPGSSNNFTCMAVYSSDRVLCGTKHSGLVDIDINTSSSSSSAGITSLNCCSSTTKLKVAAHDSRIIFAGCLDGSVAMVDTRTGKTSARGDFKATGGGRVSEIDVNSTSLMVCAGYSNKNSLEPYVRVFDLRMNNRQLNPVHFASPIGVQFLQDGSYSNVLASSASGALRMVDVSTSTNLQFANVSGGKPVAMATSYTGMSFSIVDSDNYIHFWETCPQYRDVCQDLFLEDEHPVMPQPTPLCGSVAPWYSAEACGQYQTTAASSDGLLSSFFPSKFTERTIKPSPKAVLKVRPELLQRVQVRDRVAHVANPIPGGVSGQSLLFASGSAGKQNRDLVYVNVDPRGLAPGGGGGGGGARGKSGGKSSNGTNGGNGNASGGSNSNNTTTTASNSNNNSREDKARMAGGEVDYSRINQTAFAGFEPVDFDPSTSRFTSALLQALYFIPEFRNLCMSLDVAGSSGASSSSIPVELNWVFRMLDTARAHLPQKQRCCQARNFVVALRHSADAVALGLPGSGSMVALAHFVLSQFVKMGGEARAGVERVFATTLLPAAAQDGAYKLVLDTGRAAVPFERAAAAALSKASQLAPYLVFSCADAKPCAECVCARFAYDRREGVVRALVGQQDDDSSSSSDGEVEVFELTTVVSLVAGSSSTVAHIRVGAEYAPAAAPASWFVFDDASVAESTLQDALAASCAANVLLFFKRAGGGAAPPQLAPAQPIALDVFANAKPLSAAKRKAAAYGSSSDDNAVEAYIPPTIKVKPGDFVAMDCEFVALSNDVVQVNSDGSKTVTSPRQLALARVSVVDSNFNVLIDDLIAPHQPVVDYLTRFSGLVPGDLDAVSSHPSHLFPFPVVYSKLLYLMESGCVFVGHGLDSDFKVVNITVPPEQIRDTVQLFWLRGKRKLGLRFLTSVLLQTSIQDRGARGHDSIQDACAALRLYFKYQELEASGKLQETLARVYLEGPVRNWS